MRLSERSLWLICLMLSLACNQLAEAQPAPDEIRFVRQSVRRFIFDDAQSIPLAALRPAEVIGMSAMFPTFHHRSHQAQVEIRENRLRISSDQDTRTGIWFGGFNSFATYFIHLHQTEGEGATGFDFTAPDGKEFFRILMGYKEGRITDVIQEIQAEGKQAVRKSVATHPTGSLPARGELILQMFGSGFTLYLRQDGLPQPIAQSDFAQDLDLRQKRIISSFQSRLLTWIRSGSIEIKEVKSNLNSGMGLADIRAITYEDGTPLLDQGRLWYTMTMRGRALPHHVQGVLSMDPTVFDLRLEGVIVFDRNDGLLRNEVASHIFFDRRENIWRGMTTGFSSYALRGESKQLLAVESKKDPRFGFSVMTAAPFGIVGDIEDPHILFDEETGKWRILTCENVGDGYKAIMLESTDWNRNYVRIAGPVAYNSTGTSIQRIGNKHYCFSGSKDRKIYIYTYPDLKEAGTLRMDLPPWDETSGTRVWPNVVELPEGYPVRYVALMMDRFNYPELTGPNWTYGALYLYHGY